MNISPVMMKALFSAIGVDPNEIMLTVEKAINEISEMRQLMILTNYKCDLIMQHFNIEFPKVIDGTLEDQSNVKTGTEN